MTPFNSISGPKSSSAQGAPAGRAAALQWPEVCAKIRLMALEDIEGSGRVAVMGGTFDPIHHAHLLIAEDVRLRFGLDQVVFMPSGAPPHKPAGEVSPAEDRYLMAVLATSDNPHFVVSRLEIDRPGNSYTIDTVRHLKAKLGERGLVYLIVGADSALEMDTWYEPDSILTEARVIAVSRAGFDLSKLPERLGKARAEQVTVVVGPSMTVSSTEIRQRIAAGQSARYMCPRPVLDYIQKRGLYRLGSTGAH